jgi:hypothetical protein
MSVSEDNKRLLGPGTIMVGAMAIAVLVAVVFRNWPRHEAPAPSAPVVRRETARTVLVTGSTRQAEAPPMAALDDVGRALNASAIRTLIQNYRLASYQGNDAVAKSALQALKRKPDEARQILRNDIARTEDRSLVQFYQYTLEGLGQ